MINVIKSILPLAIRIRAERLYKKIKPPRITLDNFYSNGCVFEIINPMEEYRVISLADEEEFIRLLLEEIQPGDILFDIGSCIGMHALHAALYSAKVFAFEPDPSIRKRLKRNIKINKLKKDINVINWAVSNKKGKEILYTDGIEGNSPSLRLFGDRSFIEVDTDTIDNKLIHGDLPSPTLIKMDIEGAEILALQGMKGLLTSEIAPRKVFIELHPEFLGYFNSSMEECMNIFKIYGYKLDYCKPRQNQIHCIYNKSNHYL